MADEECFPPGLQRLTEQLLSPAVPGMTELPDLTDVQRFGPCFNSAAIRSQGTRLTESGSWAAVRLKVLSLVATCPTLTHVNLSNCCIDDESEMRILGLGLEKSETLENLNLSGNMVVGSKAGCGYINRILKGSRKLHTVNLARVGMSWEGMARISGAKAHDIALRHLDVSGNPNLGDNGMALLSAVLKGQLASSQQTGSAGGDNKFRGLTSLTVGYMGVGGAKHLAQALAAQTSHGSLEVLKIVGPTDEEEVLEKEGSPLRVLLSSLIHPGPVTEYDDMAAPVMYNESLKLLSLKFVKEDGLAGILAEILRSNDTLMELHVEGSEFSSVEWREIIHALQENTTLKSLFIGSCRGLGDTFNDFMDLIRANSTIEFIDLPNTELERSGQNLLIMAALDKGRTDTSVEEGIRESFQNLKVEGVPSQTETWGENITGDNLQANHSESEKISENDDSSTFILNLKTLPEGLLDLILELRADSPTITVLPRLSTLNIEQFGDFFAFPHFNRESKDKTWWQTRRAILYIICCCPTLSHIDLEGCGIHKDDEVQDLCFGLGNSQNLQILNLGGNGGFGTEAGCLHLCRLLVTIPTLTELHLHAIDMKPDFVVNLTAAIRRTPNCGLQTLDINFNSGLGDEGAGHLATLLADQENSGGIRHLRMFGTGMGIKGASLMAIALRKNTTLKSLFVGFETEDENAEGPLSMLVSAFVGEPSQIQERDGSSTQLGCNTTLENLGVCGGRETGLAPVLAKILEMSNIRALTLNCTYFTPAEWQVIFKSLRYNTSLEALDMTQCEGLDAAVHQEMMTMLQSNRKLSDITLAETELERSGRFVSVNQELLQRAGSSSSYSSGTPYLTPTGSSDLSQHGSGNDTPPVAVNNAHYAPPVTGIPYDRVPGPAHPVQETPSWIPTSSAPGPPAYFESGPPGQPSKIPGPPAYFSSGPSQEPPRAQTSVSYSHPPQYPVSHPPAYPGSHPPAYPGFSIPVGPGAYQAHGGGYMMTPEPVTGHHIRHQNSQQSSHHVSHQSSHGESQQNPQDQSNQIPPQLSQSSNEWSPSGEPAWWAPQNAEQSHGTPSAADSELNSDKSSPNRRSRLKNWAREKKDTIKDTKVAELARHGKELVKDKKGKVLGKLGKKMTSKA